jgi:membrane protein implicated in regulation of membrane protease activity
VRAELHPVGQVFLHGALWQARSADPDKSLAKGARVEVEAVDGLTLTVRQTNDNHVQEGEDTQ